MRSVSAVCALGIILIRNSCRRMCTVRYGAGPIIRLPGISQHPPCSLTLLSRWRARPISTPYKLYVYKLYAYHYRVQYRVQLQAASDADS